MFEHMLSRCKHIRGDAEMVKALVEAVSKVDVKDKVSTSQYIFVTFCLHYYF